MNNNDPQLSPVAIIGIGCIFAESPDLKSYYRLLTRGISGISDPPSTHSYLGDYLDPDPKKKDHIYCNRGGYLPPIDFDPTEFGIPPNSLEATDTSQLLGLLTAKRAIEDISTWNQGWRVMTEPYLRGDNATGVDDASNFSLGGSFWITGTIDPSDDACDRNNNGLKHFYYQAHKGSITHRQSNGCTAEGPVYKRQRIFAEDLETMK